MITRHVKRDLMSYSTTIFRTAEHEELIIILLTIYYYINMPFTVVCLC